jgi:hypothetical protein
VIAAARRNWNKNCQPCPLPNPQNFVKRSLLIVALTLLSFALGWIGACLRVQQQASERLARLENQQAESIADIRQRIYGPNYFHEKGISPQDDARLEQFDPLGSKGAFTLSYVGGLGGADIHLTIQADGKILITDHGASREAGRLDQERCADFFRRVITSGILNYSDDVIELKRDLAHPNSMAGRNDAPLTEFHIRVPELEIDKRFSLDPEIELQNFPDFIEYQRAAALEQEILGFIPKEDPFWK